MNETFATTLVDTTSEIELEATIVNYLAFRRPQATTVNGRWWTTCGRL